MNITHYFLEQGQREPVAYEVHGGEMFRDRYAFNLSVEKVWLTKETTVKHLKKM